MQKSLLPVQSLYLRWCERAPLPLPRAGYMAGVVNGKILIAGGSYWENGKKLWTSQLDIFDPKTNRWERSSPMGSPRSDAAPVSVGDALYLFGGGIEKEVCRDALVFREGNWSTLTHAELPEPRLYAAAAAHEGQIYLTGGLSTAGDYSTATNTLWVWNPQTPDIGWKILPPIPGPGRINHAMATLGPAIYVFGGATSNGATDVRNLDDLYSFDPRTITWTRHAKLPLARRAWWAVGLDQSFLLLGGCTETYEKEVFEYDPGTHELRTIGLLPHPLADTKFFRVDNLVIGAGGETADRIRGHWTLQAELLLEMGV